MCERDTQCVCVYVCMCVCVCVREREREKKRSDLRGENGLGELLPEALSLLLCRCDLLPENGLDDSFPVEEI